MEAKKHYKVVCSDMSYGDDGTGKYESWQYHRETYTFETIADAMRNLTRWLDGCGSEVEYMGPSELSVVYYRTARLFEVYGEEPYEHTRELLFESSLPKEMEIAIELFNSGVRVNIYEVLHPGEVRNKYDEYVDYSFVEQFMDDELREELHAELAPCTNQTFFDRYAEAHLRKFGEEWIADTEDPEW